MSIDTTRYDVADYLTDEARVAAYLEEAFESGDTETIAGAFGDVARAKGMSELARDAGLTRGALYQSLSREGNPRLSTLLGVTRALGVRLSVAPVDVK